MQNLNSIINGIVKNKNLEWNLIKIKIYKKWFDITGINIHNHSNINKYNKGTLYITTESNVWAQELSYMKYQLIKKYEKILKGKYVKDIIFRVGKIDLKKNLIYLPQKKNPSKNNISNTINQTIDKKKIKSIVKNIKNKTFRKLTENLFVNLELEKLNRSIKKKLDIVKYDTYIRENNVNTNNIGINTNFFNQDDEDLL